MRRAHPPFVDHWATVGGFVDAGEHPADAARREARRGLGLDVALIGILGVYGMPYPRRVVDQHRYVAEMVDDPVVSAEVLEWAWFTADELPEVMAWNHREPRR